MNPLPNEPYQAKDDRVVQNVLVLGATGSIGTATLDVLRKLNQVDSKCRWNLWGASGHSKLNQLLELCSDESEVGSGSHLLFSDCQQGTQFRELNPAVEKRLFGIGPDALTEAAGHSEVDIVVAAIVGRAGLESTLAAIDAGKRVALANKETLVVAGPVVQQKLASSEAELLPVDSEHSAVFQCLQGANAPPRKIILTASGGPFRTWTKDQMTVATPESALSHPTWEMGPKISIDSATMMNKALEIIEAKWLFDLPPEKLHVLIHPPSIVHAIVRFKDGCSLAQLSPPSMTFALQNALLFPERREGVEKGLDLTKSFDLTFSTPDFRRYPCLQLATNALKEGKTAPLVFNAANEVAVDAFLANRIGFSCISNIIEDTLNLFEHRSFDCLDDLLFLDKQARNLANQQMSLVA